MIIYAGLNNSMDIFYTSTITGEISWFYDTGHVRGHLNFVDLKLYEVHLK